MSKDEKTPNGISFEKFDGKKVGHPVVDRSEKKPVDFSKFGGKRVGQGLERSGPAQTSPVDSERICP